MFKTTTGINVLAVRKQEPMCLLERLIMLVIKSGIKCLLLERQESVLAVRQESLCLLLESQESLSLLLESHESVLLETQKSMCLLLES